MTMIRAHFDGKVFVPDEPVNIPINQAATVQVETPLPQHLTDQQFEQLLSEMDRDAVEVNHPVDWSRDSIYSGTLDDTR